MTPRSCLRSCLRSQGNSRRGLVMRSVSSCPDPPIPDRHRVLSSKPTWCFRTARNRPTLTWLIRVRGVAGIASTRSLGGRAPSRCAGPLVSQMTCSVVRSSVTTASSSSSSAWMRTFATPSDRASSNATRTSCREAAPLVDLRFSGHGGAPLETTPSPRGVASPRSPGSWAAVSLSTPSAESVPPCLPWPASTTLIRGFQAGGLRQPSLRSGVPAPSVLRIVLGLSTEYPHHEAGPGKPSRHETTPQVAPRAILATLAVHP